MTDLYVFLYSAWYFLLPVPLLLWWGFHDDEAPQASYGNPSNQRHRYARRS